MTAENAQGALKRTPGFARGMIFWLKPGITIPTGFALCDGTLGTPDIADRFIVGDTAAGFGSSGGTVSITAALTHAGAAVGAHSNHILGQAVAHATHVVSGTAAHSNHVVGQAGAHSNHAANVAHTHNSHGSVASSAVMATQITPDSIHAANATHVHDAHDAHLGANLDAHSAHTGAALSAHAVHAGADLDAHSAHAVTATSDHAIIKHIKLRAVMKL